MQVSRKEISAALKANGIKPSYVGSRYESFVGGECYRVKIKHHSVSREKVKEALGFLEDLSLDKFGGTLKGGNCYLLIKIEDDHKNFFKNP